MKDSCDRLRGVGHRHRRRYGGLGVDTSTTNYGFIMYTLILQITSTLLIIYSQDDNVTSDALTRDMHAAAGDLATPGAGLPATGAGGDRRDERMNDGSASEDTESEDEEVAAITTLAQALASGSTAWVVTQHTRPVDHHLTGQRTYCGQVQHWLGGRTRRGDNSCSMCKIESTICSVPPMVLSIC